MTASFVSETLAAAVTSYADAPVPPAGLLIGGKFREASAGGALDGMSPIDGKAFATLAAGMSKDVDDAVASARQAFSDRRWVGLTPKERKRRCCCWAELIEARRAELAVLQARDMGMPVALAFNGDLGGAVEAIRWYGEAIDKIYDEVAPLPQNETPIVSRIPLGVVGAIVPWNFPAMIAGWKLGPALAVGNSVVLKPAEDASLVLLEIAHIALEAGIPEGVLNVVTGRGHEAGAALAAHGDVDCITFTGSGLGGRSVMEASARSNMKRVSLECGGKSANITMADAPDLAVAAAASARAIFMNQGQICNAPSRLLVQRRVLDEVLDHVERVAKQLSTGSPLDPNNDLGPIVNRTQISKVHAAIERAESEGSRMVADSRSAVGPEGGFYCGPTVAADVSPASHLGQEEVFGPVLAVMPFDTPEEAVTVAHGTRYGPGAALWSRDSDTVHWMVSRLFAGTFTVNGIGRTAIEVPFGGTPSTRP